VGEASNGLELLEMAKEKRPDIVIMDIKMPHMNGIEAAQELLKLNPDTKIIVLSMFGDEEHFKQMLELGVCGFLLKNTEISELDKALQSVADEKPYFSSDFIPFFTNNYIQRKQSSEDHSPLTRREVEIIEHVAQGYTNQEIADNLFISLRTVTTHRANINMKLHTKNTAQLIAYAIKNNLVKI
jgi:DNA-binding NarL/FixJ family response regulator